MLVHIESGVSVNAACVEGRSLARSVGFSPSEQVLIATMVSELARNIVRYAATGDIELSATRDGGKQGIAVVARDRGPGIVNVDEATRTHTKGMHSGKGLPGVKRLADVFHIESKAGCGTVVSFAKWAE